MNKPLLITAVVLIACCSLLNANAQTDSTYYDLGRVKLKKAFTQSITIKGSDLERYQFADLSDAINAWLYGTYTNPSSVVYVVDGNMITDVNAYSIYDIDEITLVQNAAAQANGANPAKQMILIKTHIGGPGKQGIVAAGQTSVVNLRNPGITPSTKGTTNFYNQYYLSAYKNYDNTHFGISADYQRDVSPILTSYAYNNVDAFHYNRFKINAHADTRLWRGTTLNIGVNYVPQTTAYGIGLYVPSIAQGYGTNKYGHTGASQHNFGTNLSLSSNIAAGLTNTLSVAYDHYNYFETDSSYYNDVTPSGSGGVNLSGYSKSKVFYKTSNFLINDNLVYHGKVEGINIEPAIDFSFRKLKDSSYSAIAQYQEYGSGGNQFPFSLQTSSYYGSGKAYLLTPSLSIFYKDIFSIQGGAAIILNSNKDFIVTLPKNRVSPFITTSFDISKLTGLTAFSFKIYGSASRQNPLINGSYTSLFGFYSAGSSNSFVSAFNSTGNSIVSYQDINPYAQYNSYQLGTAIGLSKNLTFNYSFEYRYYNSFTGITTFSGLGESQQETEFFDDKTITNRLGLNYNYHSGNFDWVTGFNMTESKLQVINNPNLASYYNTNYLQKGHRWSGGFTNRFNYQNFFAGLDVLYQLGERPYSLVNTTYTAGQYTVPGNNNSFALQNLYAGTRLKISNLKYTEVFINTRNILQNKSSDITDNRRFVGLGFKVGL